MNKIFRLESKRASRGRGFTLIEVMVALVVTTLGLLGLAALQLTSLRFSHGTSSRSQATFLAADIVERMRANVIMARSGSYAVGIGAAGSCDAPCGADIADWKAALANQLPSGDGGIQMGLNNFVTVTVQWAEQDNAAQQFTYSTRL